MPAKSKAQRRAAAIALEAAEGRRSIKSLKGASRSMYESMTRSQLREYATGSEARKPEHVNQKKRRKSSLKHKNKRR